MEERAGQRLPVLLECGQTILVDEAEIDWSGKYFCGICGHDSIIDLRRRPIRKIDRTVKNKIATFLQLLRH